jgi:hypothetical protein
VEERDSGEVVEFIARGEECEGVPAELEPLWCGEEERVREEEREAARSRGERGCGCDMRMGEGEALRTLAMAGRERSRPRSAERESRVTEREREPEGERVPSSLVLLEMRCSGTWCRTVGPATGSKVA